MVPLSAAFVRHSGAVVVKDKLWVEGMGRRYTSKSKRCLGK